MKFEVEKELPRIRRSRTQQSEYGPLVQALRTGRPISIPDVADSEEAKRIGSRVRYEAQQAGFAITRRYVPAEGKLYFQRVST
jgi:hypothetical protein